MDVIKRYKEEAAKIMESMKSDIAMLEIMTECVDARDVKLMQGMIKDLIRTKETLTRTNTLMQQKYKMQAPVEADEIYHYCMKRLDQMIVVLNKKLGENK
jgi:non-canonical (house-cleaning) NTP pyrophosphatase